MSEELFNLPLRELEARVRRELKALCVPMAGWVRTSGGANHVYDVIVIGGGQAGLAITFNLLMERVTDVVVLDANAPGQEGPWRTFARMNNLRSPKDLVGVGWPIASLTFRSYYEARFGAAAWMRLERIPTALWMDYLCWFRRTLGLPVRNNCRVDRLGWNEEHRCVEVELTTGERLRAREVVLATGSTGTPFVPDYIREGLPPARYHHSSLRDVDYAALRGARVGVLGGGASAYDNAITAARAGAQVRLFSRRGRQTWPNYFKWATRSGFLRHHGDCSDRQRWALVKTLITVGQPPPGPTLAQARSLENLSVETSARWRSATVDAGGEIVIECEDGQTHRFDHLVVGTGFRIGIESLDLLRDLRGEVLRWRHRMKVEAPSSLDGALLQLPYLGDGFQLMAIDPDRSPALRHIYLFQESAILSHGLSGVGITGLKFGVPRLVEALTRSLFVGNWELHFAELEAHCRQGVPEPEQVLDEHGMAALGPIQMDW